MVGNIFFKKGLVLAIMILFIIVSVAPCISGYIRKINIDNNVDQVENETVKVKRMEKIVSTDDKKSVKTYKSSKGTLYVGGGGPGNYTRIQDAIDNASDGDTVFVFNGIYYENVEIHKTLSLVGEHKNGAIIDGGGTPYVVRIFVDFVNVSRFTIQNGIGGPGVHIDNSDYATISGNNIINNGCGIYLWDYYVDYDSNNTISDNIIQNNGVGIYIDGTSGNNFVHNTITNNNDGIYIDVSADNTFFENTIAANSRGIHATLFDENNFSRNNITGNTAMGIYLIMSDYNVFFENTIAANYNGIWLESSDRNILFENQFEGNLNYGLVTEFHSDNNKVYLNNFVNNAMHAYDECNNNWDNGYPTGGNYWDDYPGDDQYQGINQDIPGSDGIGDTSHSIPQWDAKDQYPLMFPWYGMVFVDNDADPIWYDATHVQTIREGINNATAGQIIYVYNGSYFEQVTIDKELHLIGQNMKSVIVDGDGNGDVISVSVDSVSITGFTVQNGSSGAGIKIDSFITGTNVHRNIISNNLYGIWVPSSSNNGIVIHNAFIDNLQNAYDEDSTTLWDDEYPSGGNYWDDYTGTDNYRGPNQDIPNGDGIGDTPYNISGGSMQDRYPLMYPWSGKSATVFVDDDQTIDWYDRSHVHTIQEGINNVTVEGTVYVYNGMYYEHVIVDKQLYLVGEDKEEVIVDAEGTGEVIDIAVEGINITGFTMQHGVYGIKVRSDSNNITGNIIANNSYGMWFKHSDDNLIVNNQIKDNDNYGIWIEFSATSLIFGNQIEGNNYGIHIANSNGNFLYHNNFNNTLNAYDSGSNVWNDTYLQYDGTISGGNYWSDYTGIDLYCGLNQDFLESDGIGDTPYNISGNGNQDRYPLTGPWNGTPLVPTSDTVYVDDDFDENTPGWGYCHFNTIQKGIDTVLSKGTVYVSNGMYYEDIVIEKPLSLVGENREYTVINGGGAFKVVTITADNVNISGFMITNGKKGIDLYNSSNTNIFDNIVENEQYFGINLYISSHTSITANIIVNNDYGISLGSSANNTISSNTIENNHYGISIENSPYNTMIDNTFTSCGIIVTGDELHYWNTHTIENNYADSRPIRYYKNTDTPFTVPSYASQVILANCTHFTLQNLDIENIDHGIQLGFSSYTNISGNIVTNNYKGILLSNSSNNTIYDNMITGNDPDGIYAWHSSYNIIVENTFANNSQSGIIFHASSKNNTVNRNIITNNSYGLLLSYAGYVEDQMYPSGNILSENIITDNVEGIRLFVTLSGNTIFNNTIKNNYDGITLYAVQYNDIFLNNITNNTRAGMVLGEAWHNRIYENNIIDNQEYGIRIQDYSFYNTIFENTITNNNKGGIYFSEYYWWGSMYNTIADNIITYHKDGICLNYKADLNTLSNNIITGNKNGIYLYDSWYNTIYDNSVTGNENGTCLAFYTYANTISGNTIADNTNYGVYIGEYYNYDNVIYHNNFINNNQNAYDACGNTWDNGYPSGGNYWSDYTGSDNYQGPNQDISGSDDIGDTPYNISGGDNHDRYPLMYPQKFCGDSNGDGTIDVGDVVFLINYLYRSGPEPKPELCVGDCNGDGVVDLGDVVYLINYLFRGGATPGGCCEWLKKTEINHTGNMFVNQKKHVANWGLV